MLRAPLVLALCCAITITAASPLTEENINKTNLKQPKTDTVTQYVRILEEKINVKLNTVKTELEENLKTLINNLATQISNDVNKMLAELEVKCADQFNTKQNGSAGEQSTESSTLEASVLKSTTDQVDISESNNAGTNVITKQKTDGQENEDVSDWWDTICNDPANDAKTSQNKNEENIKLDEYDTRLRNITGCDTETIKSFSSVGWPALSKRKPELWLAVRVLEANDIAHISFNLGNARHVVYFAVSSMGHTLARNTYLTSDDLSRFQQATNITPQEHREHYIPMYFKLEDDDLKWRVGCGNHIYKGVVENLNMTGVTNIRVGVRASDYPLKILFDCPPQTSRQHTNIQGLPDCRHSVMMEQLKECMREIQTKSDNVFNEPDCKNVAQAKKCNLELLTKMKACDDHEESIDRLDSLIKTRIEPLLKRCSSIEN